MFGTSLDECYIELLRNSKFTRKYHEHGMGKLCKLFTGLKYVFIPSDFAITCKQINKINLTAALWEQYQDKKLLLPSNYFTSCLVIAVKWGWHIQNINPTLESQSKYDIYAITISFYIEEI